MFDWKKILKRNTAKNLGDRWVNKFDNAVDKIESITVDALKSLDVRNLIKKRGKK